MRYTDQQLEVFLADTESDFVERKEAWQGSAPEKGREAVCAFANDLPGHGQPGVLFVGARDDGTPSGITIDDRLLQTLADIKTDGQIIPPPTLTVEKRQLRGAQMAVVTVQPADSPPVRYRQRVWVRIGPRRGLATPQDERILSERRRHRDIPFDVHPVPSSTLHGLSRLLFEEVYLPNAVSREDLEANERSYEQRLAACKMVASADDPVPTVLGLLVLGVSPRDWLPGACIEFLRINGAELADPVTDSMSIDGALSDVLRRIDEKFDSHNRVAVDLTSRSREVRKAAYPRAAFQQIVRNAVMHRTYEGTNAPVRVYWFDDRIEVYSPGGPFGSVTRENFGRPGVTDYRNPNLAGAMKTLGFVQRFGVGIATARRQLRENGNPPAEFQVTDANVLVVMWRRR